MARNASGTYTLPAGNPVVAHTLATSTWANTTLADLQTEMTDSLSRTGKGGMLSALQLVDGVVGTPALSFASEPSTGLYRAAAGDLRVALQGVDRLRLGPAASAPFVATSPQAAAGTATDFLLNTANTRTAGDLFAVQNNGSSKFRADTGGNLYLYGTVLAAVVNSSLLLRGNRDAASALSDVILNSQVTRTAGYLLHVQNNSTDRFQVGFEGSLYHYGTDYAAGTNSSLILRGNRDAADTGADVVLNSLVTRTAGSLLNVQNNGADRLGLDNGGNLYIKANLYPIDANATLPLVGRRNAADTGTDVAISSINARTAGALLSVQNGGVAKFDVDFNGEPSLRGGLACGVGFKTDADQTEAAGAATNITGMSFPVEANGIYTWEVVGSSTQNAADTISADFTGPAAPTSLAYGIPSSAVAQVGFSGAFILKLAGTDTRVFHVVGRLVNGANAGTVQMRFWRTTSGTATLHKGCALHWRRIG